MLPIHRYPVCLRYDFPPEGLVAWRYRAGWWRRMPAAELPASLHVNLVRTTHGVAYWKRSRKPVLSPDDKRHVDARLEPPHGSTLADLVRYYADLQEGCASMRPPPDAERDALTARIAAAERAAPLQRARLREVSTEPRAVTREERARVKGEWRDAYVMHNCKGIVLRNRGAFSWYGDENRHGASRTGDEVLMRTPDGREKKLRFGGAGTVAMQRIACDNDRVTAIRRAGEDRLFVYRFDRGGDVLDAFVVLLPRAPGIAYPSRWVGLWNVAMPATGPWTISLADFQDGQGRSGAGARSGSGSCTR